MRLRPRDVLSIGLRPLQLTAYWLSGLVPRRSNRWVFGSWHGRVFGDNAAALFLHCTERRDVEPIWIATDPRVRRQVRARGLCAYHPWSLRGLYSCTTAGVFLFTSTTRDINCWVSRGAKNVLLRHGVGIKKIGRGHTGRRHRMNRLHHGSWWQRMLYWLALPWHKAPLHLVIATSPLHAEQACEYFGVEPEQVEITGFPRNDLLLRPRLDSDDPQLDRWLADVKDRGASLFFYMPTFRDDGRPPFEFAWPELDRRLDEIGAALLVRCHLEDRSGFAEQLRRARTRNIRLHDRRCDPYRVLGAARALITDYSSVAYDFLLLSRPLIFFAPDLEQYSRQRTLSCNYEEAAPGLRARNLEELLAAIATVTRGAARLPDDAASRLLDRLQTYRDPCSSERVYTAVRRRLLDPGPQTVQSEASA